jgi:ABC-type Fe3+/spermidine/putrescine transport system ATPase subunit
MPPFLLLDRLAKTFGVGDGAGAAGNAGKGGEGARKVLHDLTLAVERGEVVALLGPSGSGKTTALRLIAGFETPDPGGARVLVEGQDVTGQPPARRNFGMVFQHYALFPHLTVGGNVAFGLEGRRLDREQVRSRVAAALALVDLPGFERRRVGEISGGQQQRVALARALAPEPRVLLLDEPLSNLDPALRERTRRELRRAIRRVGITTLLVTHEQEEAFHLGDRVAVLEGGVLHQVGTPEDLYDRPATRFVATFVGRASVLPGVFAGYGQGAGRGASLGHGEGETDAAGNIESGAGWVRLELLAAPDAADGTTPAVAAGARRAGSPDSDASFATGVGSTAAGAGSMSSGSGSRAASGASDAAAAPEFFWPGVAAEPLAAGEAVELVVRPEALALVPPDTAGALAGRVAERRYAGPVTYYQVELPGSGIEVEVASGAAAASPGDMVAFAPAAVALSAGGKPPASGRIFRRPAAGSAAAPAGALVPAAEAAPAPAPQSPPSPREPR